MISTTYSDFAYMRAAQQPFRASSVNPYVFPHDNYLALFPSRGTPLVTVVASCVQTVGLSAARGEEAQDEWLQWEMVGAAQEMST